MRTERELLADCLRRLNGCRIEYMLTGSMASNFWGIPRTTHDLDFVVRFAEEDVAELIAAFADAFFVQESAVRLAFQPPYQFNLLDNQSALKVDCWMLRAEPFEQAMFQRRVNMEIAGERAWLATAEDVLLHKLYWHALSPSDRQLGDAAGIVAVQGPRLDRAYLILWAERLNVRATLDDVLSGKVTPKTT